MPSRVRFIAVVLILAAGISAQRVILPNGTGGVTPSAPWITLRTAELEKDERPTDPVDEPARRQLLGLIATLRSQDQLGQHLLFHRPGKQPGQLQLVDAYSSTVNATSDELLDPDRATAMMNNLQGQLATDGVRVEPLGHERSDLFEIAGLRLSFRLHRDGNATMLDAYCVPAGKHLQYFECYYPDGSDRAETEAVVRSFDGATEDDVDLTLRNMIFAGMGGAILGIAAALLRNHLHRRKAQG